MSDRDGLYRVLYTDADGHEQLTGAMPYDAARSRARELEARGYGISSVMDDVAARDYMHARYAPTYRGVEEWKRGVDSMLDEAPPPDTFMGVPVPPHVRAGWDKPQARWWRAGVEAAVVASAGKHEGTDR
jgi:hypothetical protein